DFDDSAWKKFKVPGGYSVQGLHGRVATLRREVDLPPQVAGRELLLLLGDTRCGFAQVFFNGRYVGAPQRYASGLKTEISGTDAWQIPAELAHPGRNVVTLHVYWGYPGQDGILDSAAYLGPREALEPFYVATGDLRRALQHGMAFVMLFMAATFLLLM